MEQSHLPQLKSHCKPTNINVQIRGQIFLPWTLGGLVPQSHYYCLMPLPYRAAVISKCNRGFSRSVIRPEVAILEALRITTKHRHWSISRTSRKMVNYCRVSGCTNRTDREQHLEYVRLIKDVTALLTLAFTTQRSLITWYCVSLTHPHTIWL